MTSSEPKPFRLCLLLASIVVWATAAVGESLPTVTWDGIAYGPETSLSGIYFTNFENSKFIECQTRVDCEAWPAKDGNAVECQPRGCEDLEAHIRAAAGNHDVWSTYQITFIGRRSIHPSPKAFLGDTDNKVLLERITSFKLIEVKR